MSHFHQKSHEGVQRPARRVQIAYVVGAAQSVLDVRRRVSGVLPGEQSVPQAFKRLVLNSDPVLLHVFGEKDILSKVINIVKKVFFTRLPLKNFYLYTCRYFLVKKSILTGMFLRSSQLLFATQYQMVIENQIVFSLVAIQIG